MKTDDTFFWDRFDSLMKARFPDLIEFCKVTGLNYNTIISQRQRKIVPKIDQLIHMAKALETTIDYLVTGKEQIDTLAKHFNNNSEMIKFANRITLCTKSQILFLNNMLDTWGIDKEPGEFEEQDEVLA